VHPSLNAPLDQLKAELGKVGIGVRVLETDRSPERQAQLYAQGRSEPGPVVTHAKPYESAHNWGLALDVQPVPPTDANWRRLRSVAAKIGFGLIGEWDPGHLQHPAWPQVLAELRRSWKR
jgi:hypothetical protein